MRYSACILIALTEKGKPSKFITDIELNFAVV